MSQISDRAKREVEHVVQMAVRDAIESADVESAMIMKAIDDIECRVRLRAVVQRELTTAFKGFFETFSKVA